MLKNKNILKNEIKYKWKILLVSKLWKSERSAFLKFFHAFLKFDLPKARFLNFPQNSMPSLIGPFLIIGDCVYMNFTKSIHSSFTNRDLLLLPTLNTVTMYIVLTYLKQIFGRPRLILYSSRQYSWNVKQLSNLVQFQLKLAKKIWKD